MTPDWINAGASLVTLLVVALAAYAALQQMRHLRSGNQTAALLSLIGELRDESYLASQAYVMTQLAHDLDDPENRAGAEAATWTGPTRQALRYLRFYEALGSLVFSGALELDLVLRYFLVAHDWQQVEPLVLVIRRRAGPSLFEMFEALAMAEARYIAQHGDSWYPRGLPRTTAVDQWLAVDRRSSTSSPGHEGRSA